MLFADEGLVSPVIEEGMRTERDSPALVVEASVEEGLAEVVVRAKGLGVDRFVRGGLEVEAVALVLLEVEERKGRRRGGEMASLTEAGDSS